MAEIVVNIVLTKLTDAVLQKAFSLYEVGDKIESIQRELKWIQAFVKDADSKRHKNNRVKCWVNEVQEVSYLIEDTLEEFLIKVGGADNSSTLKKMGKLPMKLYYKSKLGAKIDKILQRLDEISANTDKYKIEGLDDSSAVASSDLVVRPHVIPGLDETEVCTEVVGFEDDMEVIFKQLVDANVLRRSVLSIVGAGGFGKTTLAKRYMKEEYKLKDILIKILDGMGKSNSQMREKEEDQLITEIYNCIKERTYLVVLDDVWSADLWTQLQVALPKTNNGSRVLITTRYINIAEEADVVSKPHKIKPLDEEKSKQLLLKHIFPNHYANECPEDLLPLAPQFVKKCGGCPLALVVLGGFLSRRCPTYNAWDDVMRNMHWHTDGNKCMGVLSTSFNHLPIHLKTCFMYFANFPEDCEIKVSTLVQLWIAEGFIPDDASTTMEDIAEGYLEELVERCMVQVSRWSVTCKIKYCQIHDLLREVAIKKAKENNFLRVFSKNDTHGGSCSTPRVSLNNYGNVPLEHTTTNLLVNYYEGCVMQNRKRFGMLRVFNLLDAGYLWSLYPMSNDKKCELNWVKDLTTLRYFRDELHHPNFCWAGRSLVLRLPSLSRMKNLQTVYIKGICKRHEISESLWKNKMLRHVKIEKYCVSCRRFLIGPPSSADLQKLLTLIGVIPREEWNAKLPHFPNLRKLGLITSECADIETIVNSVLSNLQYLGSFFLFNQCMCLPIPCCYAASAFRNHQRLLSFRQIYGIWPKQTSLNYGSMFPPHLLKLELDTFDYEEDPMPHLEKLPNLLVLILKRGELSADGNRMMTCSRRGFSRLEQLTLLIGYLEEWKIEEGAMPQLNKLQLLSRELKTVPDFQYLTNLRELTVWHANSGLKSKMQGDDAEKIKHIPSVIFYSEKFLWNIG